MLEELQRRLDAARIPLPLNSDGGEPGDLWGGDDRFIGSIDEPLVAAVIVGAVNALPAALRLARAARRRIAAVRAYEALDADPGASPQDRAGVCAAMDDADAEIRAALAALGVGADQGAAYAVEAARRAAARKEEPHDKP